MFTRIPNNIIDNLKLNPYQFQILSIIIRKTDGWCKTEDGISLSQFEKLVTFTKKTIIKSINELIDLDLIEKKVNYNKKNKNYSYSIYKISQKLINKNNCGVVEEIHKGSVLDTQGGSVQDTHTKETNNTKETNTNIKKYIKKDLIEIDKIQNHKYKDLILEFIEHRKQLKKQMTKKALELFISKINDFSLKGYNIKEIVEKSILSGYMTIYEPKNNNTNNFLTASEQRKIQNDRVVQDFFNDSKNQVKKITDENMFLDVQDIS